MCLEFRRSHLKCNYSIKITLEFALFVFKIVDYVEEIFETLVTALKENKLDMAIEELRNMASEHIWTPC